MRLFLLVLLSVTSIGASASSLSFTGPQGCEAVFSANALNRKLKWDDDALRNDLSDKSAWVVCPIEFDPAVSEKIQVSVRIGNQGASTAEAFCYLKEIDDVMNTIQGVNAIKDIPAGFTEILTLELNRRDTFATVSLTCRIPGEGQLGNYSVYATP